MEVGTNEGGVLLSPYVFTPTSVVCLLLQLHDVPLSAD